VTIISAIKPDVKHCLEALHSLMLPGHVHEMRVLKTERRGTVSGYFDNPEALAKAACDMNLKAPGVYFTFNPVSPALLARSANHVSDRARTTTSDTDIVKRVFLPIDVDAQRPKDISSTEMEHQAAIAKSWAVYEFLVSSGFPVDSLLWADSGNGGHVLIRVDLPNDIASTKLVNDCLKALDFQFSDNICHIDTGVGNAARIWKVYGTIAAKGDSTPDRPHRMAQILHSPEKIISAPIEALQKLAALAPTLAPEIIRGNGHSHDFDLTKFISEYLQAKGPFDWNGGRKWPLVECPFNPEHRDGSAFVGQFASGAITFRCLHNSCSAQDWKQLREKFEPVPQHNDANVTPLPSVTRGGDGYIERDNAKINTNRDKNVTQNVTSEAKNRDKSVTKAENLSRKVVDWVHGSNGWWTSDELDKELAIFSEQDKANRRQIISRLREQGTIEQHQKLNKHFRFVNTKVTSINFKTASNAGVLDLSWPLDVQDYVNLYPGNIAVVAGSPNAGKTAMLLSIIHQNQGAYPIYYFCSEMGEVELRNRLDKFPGMDVEDWKFTAIERASDFEDVIVPNCINIIDYLEMTSEMWEVNTHLTAISHKLGSGIAVVALQKKIDGVLGRGAEFGLEKPKLYLSLDKGKLTIVKGKSWAKKDVNPNGLTISFKIVGGCQFEATSKWDWKQ